MLRCGCTACLLLATAPRIAQLGPVQARPLCGTCLHPGCVNSAEVIHINENEKQLADLIVRLLREDRKVRTAVLGVVRSVPEIVGKV